MAVRHGATIIPFAGVGAEDAFDIVLDGAGRCMLNREP